MMRGNGAVGVSSYRGGYVAWEVHGDTLTVREGASSVDLRLGDYFRALSSSTFHSNASGSSASLCFLSSNDVILRLHFEPGEDGSLLLPLIHSRDSTSSCLILSTDYILNNRSFIDSTGMNRVSVTYESLDLRADQVIACSSWHSPSELIIGLSNGDAILTRLNTAHTLVKSLLTNQMGMRNLLSGMGLVPRSASGSSIAVGINDFRLLSLSSNGVLSVWDKTSLLSIFSSSISSLVQDIPIEEGIQSGAFICCDSNGSAAVLAFCDVSTSSWRLLHINLTSDVALQSSVPLPSTGVLRDLVIAQGYLISVWWEGDGISRAFKHGLAARTATVVELAATDAHLASLLTEDAHACSLIGQDQSIESVLLRRVFMADRFRLHVIASVLNEDVPAALRVSVQPRLDESLVSAVSQVCSTWHMIHPDSSTSPTSVRESYLLFIQACHERAVESIIPSRGCLERMSCSGHVGVTAADRIMTIEFDTSASTRAEEHAVSVIEELLGDDLLSEVSYALMHSLDNNEVDEEMVLSILKAAFSSVSRASRRAIRDACRTVAPSSLCLTAQYCIGAPLSPTDHCELIRGDPSDEPALCRAMCWSVKMMAKRKQQQGIAVCIALLALNDDSSLNPSASSHILNDCLPLALVAACYSSHLLWMSRQWAVSTNDIPPSTMRSRRPALDRITGHTPSTANPSSSELSLLDSLVVYLLRRTRVIQARGMQANSFLERLIGPSSCSDVAEYLETRRLFRCLQTRIKLSLLFLDQAKDLTGRLSRPGAFQLVSSLGRCELTLSAGDLSYAHLKCSIDLLLTEPVLTVSIPVQYEDVSSMVSAVHPFSCTSHLDYSRRLADVGSTVYVLELTEDTSARGAFVPLLSVMSLRALSERLPQLFLCVQRVWHVQRCLQLLSHLCWAQSLTSIVGLSLVRATEDCVSALKLAELGDVGSLCIKSLEDDLRATWSLMFEAAVECGDYENALGLLGKVSEYGSRSTEGNMTSLIAAVCLSGSLDWLCSLPEERREEVSIILEKLHLTRDTPGTSSVFFDCFCAFSISWRMFSDVVRVSVSFSERCLEETGASSSRLRCLALATMGLGCLPVSERYAVTKKSALGVSRKRHFIGEDTGTADAVVLRQQLSIQSYNDISIALAQQSAISLLHGSSAGDSHDTVMMESVLLDLINENYLSEALFLAYIEKERNWSYMHIFKEYYRISDNNGCQQFDSPVIRRAHSLSFPFSSIDSLLDHASLPVVEAAVAMLDVSEGQLLKSQHHSAVLKSLMKKNDVVAACKVAAHWLETTGANQWVSYTMLDSLILRCREVLASNDGSPPQLPVVYALLVHKITMHFSSLIVV